MTIYSDDKMYRFYGKTSILSYCGVYNYLPDIYKYNHQKMGIHFICV